MSCNLLIRELPDSEVEAITGGMKNADLPGVQAAMKAFNNVIYCGGSGQEPGTNIAHPDGTVGRAGGGSYSNCSPA